MIAALVLGSVALVALIGTWLVRSYALRHAVLDIPNERSSHDAPTPRGGGMAILAALLAGLVAARALDWIEPALTDALIAGGLLIGGIGFLDDHHRLPAWLRAAVHLLAAVVALTLLGGLPHLDLGTTTLELGALGWLLGALGIAWSINLYNFMDGIDGIAASEAVIAGGAGAMLALMSGNSSVAFATALLAASSAGFLVWNWAPAKIFMGDVGSGLLGYGLAVVAIAAENTNGPPLLIWLVLLGVFFVDATLTLLRRMVRREKWFVAHRSHAYQRLVQSGRSHAQVTGAVIVLNLLLAAAAYAAVHWPGHAPIIALGALAMLVGCYVVVEQVRPMRRH